MISEDSTASIALKHRSDVLGGCGKYEDVRRWKTHYLRTCNAE